MAVAVLGFALSACADDGSTAASDKLKVAATTSFVADWVQQVGGDRVESSSLVPLGADPHTHQPGAGDVSRLADANLIFKIGLNFESSNLDRLLENTVSDKSNLVALGESSQPVPFEETHKEGEEEEHGEFDPHFWFDPLRARDAVNKIAAILSQVDPAGAAIYSQNASRYIQQLDDLHTWIGEQVGQVPEERRFLLTSHESLSYFADRYGFRIIGAIVPSLATDQEPSAQDITALIEAIKEHRAPAVFAESTLSDRLAQSIARDADVAVVTKLYTESLGPSGSGADTYINMMRFNVQAMVDALK
jgi:zinc/manganese transport system substrate-binding protein/manganese/iron transport system substrate-binding protein